LVQSNTKVLKNGESDIRTSNGTYLLPKSMNMPLTTTELLILIPQILASVPLEPYVLHLD
jgi:hypothetical protein